MFINWSPNSPPGTGVDPQNFDVLGIAKTGGSMAPGDFVVCDHSAAGAGVTSTDPGVAAGTSTFNSFVAPNNAVGLYNPAIHAYGGVVLEGAAGIGSGTGNPVKVRMLGIAQTFIIYSAGSMVLGDPLAVQQSGGFGQKTLTAVLADIVAGSKFYGRALQAITTPTVRQLAKVEINGHTGFGFRP